jgi:uncharacterized protein YdeI (YjbR/CyaY-like superfamily)
MTYDEAVDAAQCFGWIDGQRQRYDELCFLQKFTPRRPGSLWSKRNVGKVETLLAEGRIRPSGLAEIEAARKDGRWLRAYDSSKDMAIPADFLAALEKNRKAADFFKTLDRSNLFAIGFRLQTARKPETRQRRIGVILDRLESGQKLA